MPLGGVPTRVTVPPSEEAKATGMRILPGASLADRHMPRIMGTATTVVPVLESTVDKRPMAAMEKTSSFTSLPLDMATAARPTLSAKPVMNVPSPTMNMAMNSTTVGSPK